MDKQDTLDELNRQFEKGCGDREVDHASYHLLRSIAIGIKFLVENTKEKK